MMKHPRARTMQGVITHISEPKTSTACINVLKNIAGTLGLAPYLPNIIDICAQLFLAFRRSPTAAGQYSLDAIMIPLRNLKDISNHIGLS